MRPIKLLSLLAALALLGGAVLDAQTGLVRQALTATPDAGKKLKAENNRGNSDMYIPASKAGPLIRPRDVEPDPAPPQQQQTPTQAAPEPGRKDAGK